MIILSNGDKWIIDEFEWKEGGISYEDACECKIPLTDEREFVKMLVDSAANDTDFDAYDDALSVTPRKWVDKDEYNGFWNAGYWDANFNVYDKVLSDLAVRKIDNPWSRIYEMLWKEIVVVDKYKSKCTAIVASYPNYNEYLKAVSFTIEIRK